MALFPDPAVAHAQDSLPDAAATLRAYSAVEAFVRGTSPAVDPKGLPAVHGCSVVLRLAGVVVGRGSSIGGPGAAAGTDWIVAAAGAAMAEAEGRMPATGTGAAVVKEMRQGLLISLELNGPLMRVNAKVYADFDAALQPGVDGLLAVMEGKVGAVFPGAAAAGNVLPSQCAQRAVAMAATAARGDAGGGSTVSLTEPAELEKKHGVTLYRFRTTHVAQWRADKGPELLYRGQKLVVQGDVDRLDELWHMADRLAGNLVNRTTVKPPAGTVTLWTGDSQEPDGQSAALARHALMEYFRSYSTPERWRDMGDDAVRAVLDRTRDAADRYLLLAREDLDGLDPSAQLAACALLVRNADAKSPPEEHTLQRSFTDGVLNADVQPGLRGLAVWGNGEWPGAAAGGAAEHPMERAVRKVMAETPVASLPAEMPWLGWIDLSVDAHLRRAPGQKSAAALREMRTLLWKHQLQAVDAGPDAQDLVGGIVVPGGGPPLPTWQTARLVAFLATMLGEPELTTPKERPGEIVRLLAAARFLRQLQVDDTLGWMCNDAALVKGGIRNATWDQRTQTDATAMALLAVLETIKGIEKASAK